jgi:hypothetical protein
MIGVMIRNTKRDIICINESYVMIINEYEVMRTVVEPIVAYLENNLLISYKENGKYTSVHKYENNEFVEIGIINRLNGSLCGAFLFEDDLVMLQYEQKEILLKSLPLVVQKEETSSQQRGHKRKKLFQSISKIMEESHEEGSQLLQITDRYTDITKSYTLNINQNEEGNGYPIFKNMLKDVGMKNS